MGQSSLSPTSPDAQTPVPIWEIPVHICIADGQDTPPFQQRRHKERAEGRKTEGRRVLMVGQIRELALYRAEVLRMYGFKVATPQTLAAATNVIRRREFDIVVLSYTLPSDVVEELAELARQYCPTCPLIAISDTRSVDKRIFPDETVFAEDGPAALIAALRRVCRDAN